MSAFHRLDPSICQPLGLGIACGAVLGAAILAGTTKSRIPATTNYRKSAALGLSSWLNIFQSSSPRVPSKIRQYQGLFDKFANGSTKLTQAIEVRAPPPCSPQSSLLFKGTTFGEPKRARPRELSLRSSSPLSILRPLYSPRKSLLFQGCMFDESARNHSIQLPLSPLTPRFSNPVYTSSAGPTETDFESADDSVTPEGDDQLVTPGAITSMTSEPTSDRQDVPSIIPGFGATLTIGGGSIGDHLATALAILEKQATNERSLTLLVEFKGNVSSATGIIRDIMNITKNYLECLAVYMPNDDHHDIGSIDCVTLSQPHVLPTETSVLRHLVWKGNVISDLFSQWGSASNISFGTLHTLNLNCGLSIEDCIQILFQCENVVEFSAQLAGEFTSVMKHDYYDKEISQLRSLAIKSSVPVDHMFSTLRLEKLESIDLDLGPDAIPLKGVARLHIPWNTLQDIRVVGVLHKLESDRLVEQCSNADHHLHQMLDGTILRGRQDLETAFA
jgi:hypothetical protein